MPKARFIKLDEGSRECVQHLADAHRRSSHWIMHEAVAQYLERFKQEALASWVVYEETGRHLTGDEARDCLNTWGRPNV